MNITTTTKLRDGPLYVNGDLHQLRQAFLNLILNAVDALPPGGLIRISVSKNKKEGYLTAEVRDNGPGIPEHIQQRIFEPFFTTKGKGKGTGLGLSIVKRIIGDHWGTITAESKEGKGSRFTIRLPVPTGL